jgi:Protein of unknown function (DUF1449)
MEFLLLDALRPFVVLAGFILVLLVFEVLLMLVGLSSTIAFDSADAGGVSDGFALDAAQVADVTLSAEELAMLDQPLAVHANEITLAVQPSALRQLAAFMGLGQGPLLIWMTAMAAGVSGLGLFLQILLHTTMGAMLPAALALALALLPGLALGRAMSAWVARLVPAFESHAISGQSYHGRRGTVVIGTAKRGDAAQVRWQDLYGTTHSLMAEPLRDGDVLEAGTYVLIVKTRDRQPRLVALG